MAPDTYIINDGRRISYAHTPRVGSSKKIVPGVLFCGGFKSSMQGLKAMALEAFCQEENIAYTRFDYSGHGSSEGLFEDGDIGSWLQDAESIFDTIATRDIPGVIIIGSSMGAWIATLLARQRGEKTAGLITLAAAPDFTEKLLLPALTASQRDALTKGETLYLPSDYDDGSPYPISPTLIENSKRFCLLNKPFKLDMPVRLIHGTGDKDVPFSMSSALMETIQADDITLTLLKGADHRLSGSRELKRVTDTLKEMISRVT